MKQPPEPKIVVAYESRQNLSADEKRVRVNLKALLKESERIDQFKPAMLNDNDVSHILNIIVLHMDK